jgi:hypothetical protein
MRLASRALAVLMVVALILGVVAGCDWGEGDSFNTSGGVTMNISGTYQGQKADGRIVDGRPITKLVLLQSGNTLQVYDSNNAYYEGSVGSPNAIVQTTTGVIPAGTDMVQTHVSFAGTDVNGTEVQFVGTVRAVSVTDIEGTRTETTDSSASGSETETTSTSAGSTNTYLTIGEEGEGFFSQETGETGTGTSTTTTDGTGTETTTTYTDEYTITGANTAFVLEGNWVESSGAVSDVSGISSDGSGTVTTTSN